MIDLNKLYCAGIKYPSDLDELLDYYKFIVKVNLYLYLCSLLHLYLHIRFYTR